MNVAESSKPPPYEPQEKRKKPRKAISLEETPKITPMEKPHRVAIVVSEGADTNGLQRMCPRYNGFAIGNMRHFVMTHRACVLESVLSHTAGVWTESDKRYKRQLIDERTQVFAAIKENTCLLVNHPQTAEELGMRILAFVVPHHSVVEDMRRYVINAQIRSEIVMNIIDIMNYRNRMLPMPNHPNGEPIQYIECYNTVQWQDNIMFFIDKYRTEEQLARLVSDS